MSLLKKYRIEVRLKCYNYANYLYYVDSTYYSFPRPGPIDLREKNKIFRLVRASSSEIIEKFKFRHIRFDGKEPEFLYIEEEALKALYMK